MSAGYLLLRQNCGYETMHCALKKAAAVFPGWIVWLALAMVLAAQPLEAGERLHGQGRLWQVEGPGSAPSYLFGTMHASEASVVALPPQVVQALDQTGHLVLEMVLSPETNFEMAQAMVLTDGRSLSQIVGPELFAEAGTVGQRYGMPAAQLEFLRPWALMALFSLPPAELARQQSGQAALDQMLQSRATAAGTPVHGLETIGEQVGVFAGLPEADQVALLGAALALNSQVDRLYEDMKRAYLAGDLDSLHLIAETQQAATDPALEALLEDRLITARNHRMAERLTGHLTRGGAFVAVGALHLSGDTGVLHLLEQRGYRVKRVL